MYYTVLLLEKHSGKSQIVISNIICISVNVKNKENFYVKKVSGVCIYKSVFYLWLCNLEGFLENIVPRERISFPSYGSFINKTDRLLQHYPKSLPLSAENIRYFHYRGGFDTKTGISFTVSRDEYQELKKRIVQFICQKRRKTGMSVSLYSTNGCPRNFWQKKNWIIWGRYSKIKQMITQYWLMKN